MDRVMRFFERAILQAAQVLLLLMIVAAVYQLWYLFVIAIGDHLNDLTSVPLLTEAVQRGFGGVLLIVLGLELLETLRVYVTQHRVRLEIILVVAIIAVGRHVINLDYHQLETSSLVGLAALVIALTAGYYLVMKAGSTTSS
jgi:uncharacterized membrane protein (DUF373 family)